MKTLHARRTRGKRNVTRTQAAATPRRAIDLRASYPRDPDWNDQPANEWTPTPTLVHTLLEMGRMAGDSASALYMSACGAFAPLIVAIDEADATLLDDFARAMCRERPRSYRRRHERQRRASGVSMGP
jgi:hypothetical protein